MISTHNAHRVEHNMEDAFFENSRVDALVMERLTSSPYIMNMYAHCGMTVATDFASKTVSDVANKLNSTQKLTLAIQATQGLADLHAVGSLGRSALVHNDINLANLMVSEDGRPVLNDFNIAILLTKNKDTGETCPFVAHFPNPQWRAPEEQVENTESPDEAPNGVALPLVDEKIDVYALGNLYYRLAVGSSPWKAKGTVRLSLEDKNEVARLKKFNGSLPEVPDEIRDSEDHVTQILLKAMHSSYQWKPSDRPTASELLNLLEQEASTVQ